MHLLGYGSLISPDSASRAVGREISKQNMQPVAVQGLKRLWRAKEQVFSATLGSEVTAVFLDAIREPDECLNGVLIKLHPNEMARVALREKNYHQTDISDLLPGFGPVYTFTAKTEYCLSPSDQDVWILQGYIDKVLAGCQLQGNPFLHEFYETTPNTGLPILGGEYRFVAPDQDRLT